MLDKSFEIKSFDTENGLKGPILCLLCYDSENKGTVLKIDSSDLRNHKIRPFFSVSVSEVEKAHQIPQVISVEESKPGPLGEKLKRIVTQWPRDTADIRYKFEKTFEADVEWRDVAKRELGLKAHIKVKNYNPNSEWIYVDQVVVPEENEKVYALNRYIVFDIETDHSAVIREKGTNGTHEDIALIRVICINAIDNFENEYYSFSLKKDIVKDTITRKSRLPDNLRPKNVPKDAICHRQTFDDERDMLNAFFWYCRQRLPVAYGGHSIAGSQKLMSFGGKPERMWRNGFDIPILACRGKHLGANYQWLSPINIVQFRKKEKVVNNEPGLDVVISLSSPIEFMKCDDMFQFTQRAEQYEKDGIKYRMRNQKLDTYMLYYFNVAKVQHSGKVWEVFENNWDEGDYYCWGDTEGSYALYEKFGAIERVMNITRRFGVHPRDVFYTSRIQDHITLDFCHDKFMLQSKFEDRVKNFVTNIKRGADVLEIIRGLHGWTVTLDFKRLYPNINRAINIGPQNKVVTTPGSLDSDPNYIRTPFPGLYYKKDPVSVNNQIYTALFAMRDVADEKVTKLKNAGLANTPQYADAAGDAMACKNVTNGKHGNDGNKEDRLYDPDNYNAVTAVGRDALNFVANTLKELGYKVIGGDTDSNFLEMHSANIDDCMKEADKLVDELNKQVQDYLDKKYNLFDKTYLHLDWEDISDRCLIVLKKHYIKRIVASDGKKLKPFVAWKGLRKKKRGASDACVDIQSEVGERLIKSDKLLKGERDEELENYLTAMATTLEHVPWSYICPSMPANRDVELYANTSSNTGEALKNRLTILRKRATVGERYLVGKFIRKGTDSTIWLAFEPDEEEIIRTKGLLLDVAHEVKNEVEHTVNQMLDAVGLVFKMAEKSPLGELGVL